MSHRDVAQHVLVAEIAIHAEEGVERLEDEHVVSRESVVLDVCAGAGVVLAHAPALEALDVGEPDGGGDVVVGEVCVEDLEEGAEVRGEGAEVGEGVAGGGGIRVDGEDHGVVDWEGLGA